ncbi:hypothetical protein DEF23_23935 [Marinitenerispora sediminis]|uniref:Uncharacterized protein n=2 Tax=Marinitenerispora sediminis TaxID=1931232 RepID=A0A368SZV8_9ACTN|nr:hypothetical protein DEF28_24320 [Marinitenerispora sediminis]RCV49220.1 hypothetical protein DEF23_23935 [Marinitenerispora sediminis]RCV51553.1 hypothetical protein DEF24_23065 [Marinitenerispora sediminis]
MAVAGCGGSGGGAEQEETAPAREGSPPPAAASASSDAAPGGGPAGTWESIVDGSEIATMVVSGDEVTTSGPLSCPGSLSTEGGETVITLDCPGGSPGRERGTVETNPEGDRLFISWEGEAWGGYVDSFVRTGG